MQMVPNSWVKWSFYLISFWVFTDLAFASSLGGVASSITSSFGAITKLITAASYVAGLAFSIGAIQSFKQHKDNPTQTPLGKPLTLLFVAAALLFMPSILDVTGMTLFGTKGVVAGSTGTEYTPGG